LHYVLGYTSTWEVMLATEKKSKKKVAIKLNKTLDNEENMENEYEMMREIGHH